MPLNLTERPENLRGRLKENWGKLELGGSGLRLVPVLYLEIQAYILSTEAVRFYGNNTVVMVPHSSKPVHDCALAILCVSMEILLLPWSSQPQTCARLYPRNSKQNSCALP